MSKSGKVYCTNDGALFYLACAAGKKRMAGRADKVSCNDQRCACHLAIYRVRGARPAKADELRTFGGAS